MSEDSQSSAGEGSAPEHPRLTLGAFLGWALPRVLTGLKLPAHYLKTLWALIRCRTGALGVHWYRCQSCGRDHVVAHACRNRHCPSCQGVESRKWMENQERSLLPISYFHVVFTIPHALNPLIRQNQKALYQLLFQTAVGTLLDFGRNNLKAQIGVTAVMHTWSQTLLDH